MQLTFWEQRERASHEYKVGEIVNVRAYGTWYVGEIEQINKAHSLLIHFYTRDHHPKRRWYRGGMIQYAVEPRPL